MLAFTGGYHGLGYGALTVTGRNLFRDPFAAQLADFATFAPFPDCTHCPFGATPREPSAARPIASTRSLRAWKTCSSNTATSAPILVEPVQGPGGENRAAGLVPARAALAR